MVAEGTMVLIGLGEQGIVTIKLLTMQKGIA